MTVDKLKMHSADLTQRNIDAIAELFPTVVTETVDAEGNPVCAVDFDALRQELSDHVVEGPQERYQLDWPGKRAAAFAANAPIAKTLRPVRDESVDFDTTRNLFIEGDNLEALKLLQESYLGKVKLIYIDPPYNTGHDFVYSDDFAESTAEYLERSGQKSDSGERVVANTEANGRFHSDWLSMMYPRLKLARNMLSDEGIIFVSIDDNEAPNLRRMLDEIFGEQNFAGQFVWKKGGTGKNDSQFAVVEHEYIVAYARNAVSTQFGLDTEATVTTSYNFHDENGRYSLVRLDMQNLGYQTSLDFPITGPDGTVYRVEQRNPASPQARWRWSKSTVKERYDELVFKGGRVYTKNYEKEGARPRSLLTEERFGVTRTGKAEAEAAIEQAGVFDFPKPVRLIRHLIRIADDKGAIVLDFFAGSGTTGQAVLQQNAADGGNRSFILVQLDEVTNPKSEASKVGYKTIAEISRTRLRKAGQKVAGQAGLASPSLDTGFRSLKVDTTNMNDPLATPDDLVQASLSSGIASVKPDRNDEDLLFQVLLDWGLDLSEPIKVEEVAGRRVLAVANGALIACFADEVTDEVVQAIVRRHPLRAVFKDSGFATDAARINAEQIICEVSPETEVRAI
jgi:adenine-specific DNA-methyltransferase